MVQFTFKQKRKEKEMNFYKITNEEEKHRGMKYKTGLNVDILPFNPSGNCESGGIYFSREDILAFMEYGKWIRKVTLPENAKVYENPGSPKKWKADKVILGRKYKITPKKIKQLIKEGANPKIGDSYPLRWAAKNGNLEIVKLLLPVSDPKSYGSEALRWASINGHLKMVKLLIPVSEPKDNDSAALKWAARRKHSRIVKLLIPVSDPKIVKELKLD
jgi:hypothetical protein